MDKFKDMNMDVDDLSYDDTFAGYVKTFGTLSEDEKKIKIYNELFELYDTLKDYDISDMYSDNYNIKYSTDQNDFLDSAFNNIVILKELIGSLLEEKK